MTPHEKVVDITERFGARATTSAAERHVADWFAEQCEHYGLNVDMHEFNTVRSPGYAQALLYIIPIIIVLASRFVLTIPAVGWLFVLLLIADVALLALQLQGRGVLEAILPKGPSQNVIARCNTSPTGERQRKILLVTHLDTPLISPLNTESTAALHRRLTTFSFYYLVVAIFIMGFLTCNFAFMEFDLFKMTVDAQLWVWVVMAVLSAVPAILGLNALLMPIGRKQSPGANDSASGIAVLLSVFEEVAHERGGSFETHEMHAAHTHPAAPVASMRQASNFGEPALTEWLDLDNTFDARSTGASIGSWDNFESTTGTMELSSPSHGQATQPMRSIASNTGHRLDGFSATLEGKEVWFVATGARHSDAAGMRALLADFGEDLRDALIVNLESVGFGNLHWCAHEAAPLTVSISSRVMSLAKRAAREKELRISAFKGKTGVTDATPALFHHHKAGNITRLLGSGFPEAYRAADDLPDVCDERLLEETVTFVLEFLAQA